MTDPAGDPLLQLEACLPEIPNAVSRRELGSALDKATVVVNESQELISAFAQLAQYVELLRDYLSADERRELADGLQQVRNIGKATLQANSLEALEEATGALRSRLPGTAQIVQFQVEAAWRRRVGAAFGVCESLARVLTEIRETERLGQKFSKLGTDVERSVLLKGDASSAEQRFERHRKQLDALREELANIGADQDVVAFLVAVADQEATLEHYGETVRLWLSEREALGLFKIGLS